MSRLIACILYSRPKNVFMNTLFVPVRSPYSQDGDKEVSRERAFGGDRKSGLSQDLTEEVEEV